MNLSHILAAGLLTLAQAGRFHGPAASELAVRRDGGSSNSSSGDSGNCPAVWKRVKTELNTKFMTDNQCNGLARAAIRAIFHDCGSWDVSQGFHGGCDGSLIVGTNPDVKMDRAENRGLAHIATVIKEMASRYGTTVADMVVFAGSKSEPLLHYFVQTADVLTRSTYAAIVLCPGGPQVKTFIGRKDNTTSATPGGLPDVFGSAQSLFDLFSRKGYDAKDLAALLGAHSTSTQFFVDPAQANKSQDSTPGQWDVAYYKETYNFAKTGSNPANVFVFPSDQKLATFGDVGKRFQGFIGEQNKWQSVFSNAMERMAMFGNNPSGMVDCTSALG